MAEEANAAKVEAKAGPSMPKVLRFVFGGAAGMGATLFVQVRWCSEVVVVNHGGGGAQWWWWRSTMVVVVYHGGSGAP